MRTYILSVISVAFCGCIAKSILPEGEGKAVKKAFSLIVSLLLIVSVARPIISLTNSAGNYNIGKLASNVYSSSQENYDKLWRGTLASVTDESVKDYVKELMLEEFGLSDGDYLFECKLVQEDEKIYIQSIEITFTGIGVLINPRKIESLVGEKLDCECNVIEEWG